jgi:hypothetical protein
VTGVEVSITVDEGHLEALDDVAERLSAAGLRLGRTLPALGAIIGTLDDPRRLEDLKAVQGVQAAELSRAIDLPPPDTPVQ